VNPAVRTLFFVFILSAFFFNGVNQSAGIV
jgi:hypothetical protein